MRRGTKRSVAVIMSVVAAIAIVLLWPAPDPLAGVETVAIRVADGERDVPIDVESELRVVLDDRDIRVVAEEENAEVVLVVTDLRMNFGDIEIGLSEGAIRGRLRAVCRIREVDSGRTHVMDLEIRFSRDGVSASLEPRRFWEIWKANPPS